MDMQDGQCVDVRLHGDEQWYAGEVTKARKMWVAVAACSAFPDGYIADENSIAEVRLATPPGDG